ncbi:site-specific integrase [Leptolyngbya sp. FACHB-261]|nr:site-specific integrase [Leptolyngbya sp. FACHB-261]
MGRFKEHLKAQGLASTSVNRALAAIKSFFS